MNLVRRNTWNVFDQLDREFNALLHNPLTQPSSNDGSSVRWAPAVDIKEEENQFVLFADIPGVDPKAIDITMEKNVITVKGERNDVAEQNREGFKRVERSYGAFYRRFALPDSADADNISAKGENGVLVITIPKKAKAQPRRIAVAA